MGGANSAANHFEWHKDHFWTMFLVDVQAKMRAHAREVGLADPAVQKATELRRGKKV